MTAPLGWFGIIRLGLIQAALGAIVVLVTSTLNRVMAVELALPAIVPGALIALHYLVQVLRPRWGHGSDGSGRRTRWIMGGMALLGCGGTGASVATAFVGVHPLPALAGAAVAYTLVGLGAGMAGTGVLVLAATRVADVRRPVAAPVLWIMMIAGFAVTAGSVGSLLEPFSFGRLVAVVAGVSVTAVIVTAFALWRLEPDDLPQVSMSAQGERQNFRAALQQIWEEPVVRRFTIFVFVSMLAYSGQDLVLEPFAGAVLHLKPGQTTTLSGVQHGGALVGMIAVALVGGWLGRKRPGLMTALAVAGCLASALVLAGLGVLGFVGGAEPVLKPTVFALGVGNGAFAVAAIGAMMMLASRGAQRREGVRMGLWGAAQAVAFALGSCVAPLLVDAARLVSPRPDQAYASVFLVEAVLFVLSARLASMAVRVAPERSPSAVGLLVGAA